MMVITHDIVCWRGFMNAGGGRRGKYAEIRFWLFFVLFSEPSD
jgi:hypothetical protein